MKLIRKVTPIFDSATDILAVLAAVLIISVMLAINFSVITRFFLGLSWLGLMELVAMSLVYITFLGTTWVLRRERHVTMDILVDQLNPRTKALVNMITSILCALISLGIVWYGAQVISWKRVLFSHLTIPDAYFTVIIPVGSFFLFIQFLRRAYGCLERWRGARKPEAKGEGETASY